MNSHSFCIIIDFFFFFAYLVTFLALGDLLKLKSFFIFSHCPLCRWGPILEQGTFKNRQRLYLSEQVILHILMLCAFIGLVNFNWIHYILLAMDSSYAFLSPCSGIAFVHFLC